jgi:hypothetical protein
MTTAEPWSPEEEELFLEAVELQRNNANKVLNSESVSRFLKTRTPKQVTAHWRQYLKDLVGLLHSIIHHYSF